MITIQQSVSIPLDSTLRRNPRRDLGNYLTQMAEWRSGEGSQRTEIG
jgi:hypothetical protein